MPTKTSRQSPLTFIVRPGAYPHKWTAYSSTGRKIAFGHQDYEDYTMHHDPIRQQRYLARHAAREQWDINGIYTAGFWSRWLLWSYPSLEAARRAMERRFDMVIIISQ